MILFGCGIFVWFDWVSFVYFFLGIEDVGDGLYGGLFWMNFVLLFFLFFRWLGILGLYGFIYGL